MTQQPNLFADDPGRYTRFKREFQAQNALGDLANEILDRYEDSKMKVRDGTERDLSILVAASLGKGLKTFQAIARLCALGFGEDALILLRSNINLLINTLFVLTDPQPVERANEFIAYSHKERLKYLDLAHDGKRPEWAEKIDLQEMRRQAKKWASTQIKQRAEKLPPLHYTQGYRLYSSFEHSDVMALDAYIHERKESGLLINSGPSDECIALALGHSFGVMADLLVVIMNYFGIQRPDIVERIAAIWADLGQERFKTSM